MCWQALSPRTIRAVTWDMGSDLGQFSGHSRGVNSVDFRPCRPFRLVSSSDDMLVSFYQGPPFVFDHSDAHHKNFVHAVRWGCVERVIRSYSPDGAFVVSVSGDKTINVFDGKVSPWLAIHGRLGSTSERSRRRMHTRKASTEWAGTATAGTSTQPRQIAQSRSLRARGFSCSTGMWTPALVRQR